MQTLTNDMNDLVKNSNSKLFTNTKGKSKTKKFSLIIYTVKAELEMRLVSV